MKSNIQHHLKRGDKVTILRKDIFPLKHRKNKNGVVVRRDGEYIYVRPSWCKWVAEFYSDELKLIEK